MASEAPAPSGGAADEARATMEEARVEVMESEKAIQNIKAALRSVGAESETAGPNSLKISALEVEGLPETAKPSFELQISSPVEELELTKLYDPLDPEAEGSVAKFEGVETGAAMLTVTASDAEIHLGSSAPHDIAPLCEFDALSPKKKVTQLDVAIVPDEGGAGDKADAGTTEEKSKDDESLDLKPTDGLAAAAADAGDESMYFDAADAADDASPRPVVFCGPSGVGKGTLIDMLMKRFPDDQFGFSVSHTTRSPREGELDGVHYNFTTVPEMKKEIEEGKFIEYAEVHGKYYGTSVSAVETVQSSGKICILDIDVQGVQSVKKSSLEPLYVFIAPPSMEALEARLRGRATESEEDIVKRLGNAKAELDYGLEEGNFDRVFTNDDLQKTFEDLMNAFKEWYPHLVDAESKEKREDNASVVVTPVCTVTLSVEYEPSKKDQKDELYDLLNKASKRKATAIDKLRKSAAAVSRLSKESPAKAALDGPKDRAVKSGFLNKQSKKEAGFLKRMYDRTIGPNSLFRKVFPVAKNYVFFFGAVALMHFKGQELALPPPV